MEFPFPIQGSLADEDYAALGHYYSQPRDERNPDDISYIAEKYGLLQPPSDYIRSCRSTIISSMILDSEIGEILAQHYEYPEYEVEEYAVYNITQTLNNGISMFQGVQ